MIAEGYIFCMFFGMVSFGNVVESGMFQLPQVMRISVSALRGICLCGLGLLFVNINSVQAI